MNRRKQGLSVGRFASLYNYTLAKQQPDSAELTAIREIAANPVNQDFTDDLLLARAVAEYKRHNPVNAFGLMSQLADNKQEEEATYRSITGLWILEQGLYRPAAEMFGRNTDTTSIYYRAIALTKANDPVFAQSLWETVAKNDAAVDAFGRFFIRNVNRKRIWKKPFT